MTAGSVFVFLSVRWLVFERVMYYRLILYFYPRCRISERCFPVYWLYNNLHTACISNAMGDIRNTGYWIGYRTSDFLPVHCWCFQLNAVPATKTPETPRDRLRLPAYCSLANLITQFVILLQKRLDPWTVDVEKSSSLPQKCGFLLPGGSRQLIVTLSQQQRSRQLNPSSSPARSFSFFFLFPLLLYPEPTSSLLRSQSFQTVCWSGGKEKKSEMSLSPRNIKSGAGKKKMFFPLINPGWVRYFVEHSRLYGKKKTRRKKKCLPTC